MIELIKANTMCMPSASDFIYLIIQHTKVTKLSNALKKDKGTVCEKNTNEVLSRVKSGKFGQSSKFGQRPWFFFF